MTNSISEPHQGSHDELIALDGAYAALLRLQGALPHLAAAPPHHFAAAAAAAALTPASAPADALRASARSVHGDGSGEHSAGSSGSGSSDTPLAEEKRVSEDSASAAAHGLAKPGTLAAAAAAKDHAPARASSHDGKAPKAAAAAAPEDKKPERHSKAAKEADGPAELPPVPLWRLAEFARPQMGFFALALFFAICQGVQMPVFALARASRPASQALRSSAVKSPPACVRGKGSAGQAPDWTDRLRRAPTKSSSPARACTLGSWP